MATATSARASASYSTRRRSCGEWLQHRRMAHRACMAGCLATVRVVAGVVGLESSISSGCKSGKQC